MPIKPALSATHRATQYAAHRTIHCTAYGATYYAISDAVVRTYSPTSRLHSA
jgi:hypothetical protein